jgi:hypothetical protein
MPSQFHGRVLGAIALFLLIGCDSRSANTPVVPIKALSKSNLTEAQAIEIAKKAGSDRGRDLNQYQEPSASFEGTRWHLFFEEKPPGKPGGHFSVDVDDVTKQTIFSGGE